MSIDRPKRDSMSIEEATVSNMWEIAARKCSNRRASAPRGRAATGAGRWGVHVLRKRYAPMRVRKSCNRVALRGVSVRNSTPNCAFADHRTGATPTSRGVWFADGKISTPRESPVRTGVGLRIAHPARDRSTAVPLHSSGPWAENEQGNSTGIRRNFRWSWRGSEGINTIVLDMRFRLKIVRFERRMRGRSLSTG